MTTKTRANTKPLQILLTPDQHAKFKTLCALRGLKMTEVTIELIEYWMNEQAKGNVWLKTVR